MERICAQAAIEMPSIAQIREKSPGVCPVGEIRELVAAAHRASCGLGVMCRDGLSQLRIMLEDITGRQGRGGDLSLLNELCQIMVLCNECELSVAVAQRVLASLEAHEAEWQLHIERRQCSERTCMYTLYIAPGQCTGCGKCLEACPAGAIAGGEGLIHVLHPEQCTACGLCEQACPQSCILRAGQFAPRCPETPVPVGSFAHGLGLRRKCRSGAK